MGIGEVSKEKLASYCGVGTTFVIDDYQTLMSLIESQKPAPNVEAESEIVLTFRQTKVPIHLKDPFPLSITVRNLGEAPIAKDSILEVEGGDFYKRETARLQTTLDHGDRETISLELKVRDTADITSFPGEITVKLVNRSSRKPYFCRHGGFQVELRIRPSFLPQLFPFW